MASLIVASGLQTLFPLVVILFLAIAGGNAQVCQTSAASPLAIDANACMTGLIDEGNANCCQNNCAGPDACTNLCKAGTAATDICGNCGQCVPCQEAGYHIAAIIDDCESNTGLVGGYIFGFANPTVNVNIYHT